jgi:signal transduction histidine kinase
VPRLTKAREEAVYRVAQEALHNALRHGAPSLVQVTLSGRCGALVLEVSDDGRGFDAAAVQTMASRRLGLTSMRARAQAVGGRLTVDSRPGRGSTVRLEVPTDG